MKKAAWRHNAMMTRPEAGNDRPFPVMVPQVNPLPCEGLLSPSSASLIAFSKRLIILCSYSGNASLGECDTHDRIDTQPRGCLRHNVWPEGFLEARCAILKSPPYPAGSDCSAGSLWVTGYSLSPLAEPRALQWRPMGAWQCPQACRAARDPLCGLKAWGHLGSPRHNVLCQQ